jgi:hypothetical protein
VSGARTRASEGKATGLSRRCPARVCFPVPPYHNLRCKLRPHSARDLHVAETTVPTEYVPPGQAQWRKAAMTTVRITWADQPINPI